MRFFTLLTKLAENAHMDTKQSSTSESLEFLYTKYPLRKDCYNAITDFILESLRKMQHVCVVFYGHSGVFAQPGLEAVKQARLSKN